MSARFPYKPPIGAKLKDVDPLHDALAWSVFLREGSAFAYETATSATASLNNGAVWTLAPTMGGVAVDFSAAANSNINFGANLTHGNGDVTFFFGGIAKVDSAYHTAGIVAGLGLDSYAFGIHDSNHWLLVLRTVVEIISGIAVQDGHRYTTGMSYAKPFGGNPGRAFFSAYDWDDETLTTELLTDPDGPAELDAQSHIGNNDDETQSWRQVLTFVQCFNIAATERQLAGLHKAPCQVLTQRYGLG